jgi:NAD(P)-dependent dehydrogenase (short-subunit alcohol dehydrogenase family)
MTDVKGRTAFITGGGNGIGLGIARSLARAGAKLALADIDAAALTRAKAELGSITAVETVKLDVRDRVAYAAAADEVESALGPVSLLVNNAGVAGGTAMEKLSYELWDWYIGINLGGVINGVQTFLPRMLQRKQGGHIVNTASGAGLVQAGAGVLYTTAKFGVVGMSESLNADLKAAGIGVSVLCPGPVATDIVMRTAATVPKAEKPLPKEVEAAVTARLMKISDALQQGVSIDAVGEMVLSAVQADRLFIHTDRAAEQMIKMRSQAILDAMPA